MAKAQTYCAN